MVMAVCTDAGSGGGSDRKFSTPEAGYQRRDRGRFFTLNRRFFTLMTEDFLHSKGRFFTPIPKIFYTDNR